MDLRIVMTATAIRGETVRFNLAKQGLSARDLSKILGQDEGNTSTMFSKGHGWNKFKKAILATIKLTEDELDAQVAQVTTMLKAEGVHVQAPQAKNGLFDVAMPIKTAQALIGMMQMNEPDSKAA